MFFSHSTTTSALLLLSTFSSTYAQQAADGAIVPFTSQLPSCASQCGILYDVQGACTDPSTASTCFCADSRLTSISTGGTAAVSSICGATSCTAATDLQKIATWYDSFCGTAKAVTSTRAGGSTATTAGTAKGTAKSTATATGASSSSNTGNSGSATHGSWISTHWKWVIMLIILVFAIVGGWVGAYLFRRAYLRKKEREFEMRPPTVPWAPNGPEQHLPGLANNDKGKGLEKVYGPGVGMSNAGGHLKEMRGAVGAPPPKGNDSEKGGKLGWLRKARGSS